MLSACGRPVGRRTFVFFVILTLLVLPVPSPAASESRDAMNALRRVYAGLLTFKVFHRSCDRAVPANAAAHRAAYKWFARRHSLRRIETFFAAAPNPVPDLSRVRARMTRSEPAIRAQIEALPQTCASLGPFLEMLVRRNLRRPGITRLGIHFDLLLAEAGLTPPPAAKPSPSDKAPVSTGKGKKLNTAAYRQPPIRARNRPG